MHTSVMTGIQSRSVVCMHDAVGCQLAFYRSRVRIDPFSWRDRATWALLAPVTAQYASRNGRPYPYS